MSLIKEKLKALNDALFEYGRANSNDGVGYAYASGYMEIFMGDVLTAYVPANLRHELIDMLDKRIAMIKENDNG